MIRKILFLIFVLSASVSVFAEIKILTEQSWQVVYDASDYLEQENYEMIKQKLYNSSNTYYEGQAVNLAIAYYALAEYDAALEICKALIKYNGESLQTAYFVRGLVYEATGKLLAAMNDYKLSESTDYYYKLYNRVFRPYPSPEKQLKLVYEKFSAMQLEQTKIQKSHH